MADEAVFGVDVSALDADLIICKWKIRRDWIAIELALTAGKWFDYRFMNPVAATYLFAHEFTKAYRQAYSINASSAAGPHVKPLPDDLFDMTWHDEPEKSDDPKKQLRLDRQHKRDKRHHKMNVSGIWRSRQHADAMGMPYDVYLSRAFHWTLRYWRQRNLPRPNQLYTDLVVDRAAIDWAEYQRERFYYSKLPTYTTANYDGRVKAQNDHHEHLFEQIANRGNRAALIAQFIDEDLLPVEKIESRLGVELCRDSIALSERALAQ